MVLLDLSAAFDTIDHSTLFGCLLDWFGVGGSALKWFSSYLTECYKSVKIGSTLCNLQKLLFCVPQSSVLGHLLFSLYTFPLSTLVGKHKGVNCNFYADDFSQLRDFRNIRQFLTQDTAVSVANAFVSSRLGYCNSLFRSLSKVRLHRLQFIQNSAAENCYKFV